VKLSEKQLASLEKSTALGADARAVLDSAHRTCAECGHGTNIFNEREQQIIQEAIQWFRSPGAVKDDHHAVRFIAALAEIRALHEALTYRVRKAAEATATLYASREQTAST